MRSESDLVWIFLWAGAAILSLGLYLSSGTPAKSRAVENTTLTRIAKSEIDIVDGDTIKINKTTYRLMGFDTPETYQAKCEPEKVKGEAATERLTELLLAAKVIEIDTRGRDKYRRLLAVLYIDSKDIAVTLIREGHAVPYNGRTKRRDWCE